MRFSCSNRHLFIYPSEDHPFWKEVEEAQEMVPPHIQLLEHHSELLVTNENRSEVAASVKELLSDVGSALTASEGAKRID